MAVIKRIENLLLKLFGGSVCSFGVCWFIDVVWYYLSYLNPPGMVLPIINVRDEFFITIFFGLPLGSTLGIVLVDKFFGVTAIKSKWRLASIFIGGIVGPVLVIWILPWFGFDIAHLLPQFKTYGYNVYFVIIPCASALTAFAGDILWLPVISVLVQKEGE
jgi:hypothetical protein